jgi:hypothetical protein
MSEMLTPADRLRAWREAGGVAEDVEDLRTAFLNAEARVDRALEKLAEVAGQDAVTAAYALPGSPLADVIAGDGRPDIHDLIERSSLGEPDAVAARARVSDEEAAASVARAAELAGQDDEGDDIDWDALDAATTPEQDPRAGETGLDEFAADTTHNPAAAPASPEPTAAEVRAWCQANGVPVAQKGAINAAARAAYDAAHPEA